MQRLTVFALLCMLGSPVLIKTGVLAWFLWNKAEIIAEQCINRDKPEKHCNGQCYLAKQLKKAENPVQRQEPKLPLKLWEKAETAPFFHPSEQFLLVSQNWITGFKHKSFCYDLPPGQLIFRQIFKPPG